MIEIMRIQPFLLCFILLSMSCQRNDMPRPFGYNRLILPEPSYQPLPDSFPYYFEYSKHARLLPDTSGFSERFWVEIYYPDLRSTIHITYKEIRNSQQLLREFFNDAYTLTAKHQIKAHAIDETILKTEKGKTVVIAEIDGQVPSQMQFTFTDSVRNFVRGALYFNVRVHNDSLQPAIAYMKNEIMHLIHTFDWNTRHAHLQAK
jgi:gliding motility-associated lipoprotein GldD